jgi:hypothetical protein
VATSFWPPVKCRVPRASRPRIGPGSFTRSQDPGISSHCVSWCEGTGARSLSVIPAVEVGFPSRLYCFWSDFVRCACVQCLSLTHARTPYVPNPATHSRPTAFFGPCHRRACLGSQTGVVLLARPCPRPQSGRRLLSRALARARRECARHNRSHTTNETKKACTQDCVMTLTQARHGVPVP